MSFCNSAGSPTSSRGETSAMTRWAKLRIACGIERHDEDAAQDASVEGGDPRRGVLAPEQDAVAGAMPRRA